MNFSESSLQQSEDDKKSETFSEGKHLKRSIFSATQKRRTTRAERMAAYMKDYKRTFYLHELLLNIIEPFYNYFCSFICFFLLKKSQPIILFISPTLFILLNAKLYYEKF